MKTIQQEIVEVLKLSPFWNDLQEEEKNEIFLETCMLWEKIYSKGYIYIQ